MTVRAEMLKRLDEIIADAIRESGGHVPTGWVAFHCDLVEERCENCAHWMRIEAEGDCSFIGKEESKADCDHLVTEADFCCVHFKKKKGEP